MKQRINNRESKDYNKYGGRGISYHPDFETFVGWWKYTEPMWEKFVKENPKETPSINRSDNDGNYTYGNIEIISQPDNTRQRLKDSGHPSEHLRKPVIATCKKTEKEYHFLSTREAERRGFAYHSDISKCCLGKRKSAGGYYWRFA